MQVIERKQTYSAPPSEFDITGLTLQQAEDLMDMLGSLSTHHSCRTRGRVYDQTVAPLYDALRAAGVESRVASGRAPVFRDPPPILAR
jgi:hypothetical protein